MTRIIRRHTKVYASVIDVGAAFVPIPEMKRAE